MPKVRMEFNLPDEEWDYFHAKHGHDFKAALDEARNLFRSYRKYKDLAEPHWRFKNGKLRLKFIDAYESRHELFERLNNEFIEIIKEAPEFE